MDILRRVIHIKYKILIPKPIIGIIYGYLTAAEQYYAGHIRGPISVKWAYLSGNKLAISRLPKDIDWDTAFKYACRGGHTETAREILLNHKVWDPFPAYKDACCSGNTDIVKLIIDNFTVNTLYGARKAISRGHLEIVKLLDGFEYSEYYTLKYGQLNMVKEFGWDEKEAPFAYYSGNLELINYINAPLNKQSFVQSCAGGHLNLVKLHSPEHYTNEGFDMAVLAGHIDIVKYLAIKDYPKAIKFAIKSGNFEMVEYFHDQEFPLCADVLAIESGNLEMIKYIFSKQKVNIIECFYTACYHGDVEIIKYIIQESSNRLKPANYEVGLRQACGHNRHKAIKFLLGYTREFTILKYYSEYFDIKTIKILMAAGMKFTKSSAKRTDYLAFFGFEGN